MVSMDRKKQHLKGKKRRLQQQQLTFSCLKLQVIIKLRQNLIIIISRYLF